MNGVTAFILACGTVFIAGILVLALYLGRSMFLPTRGKRIDRYTHAKKALLVMDIQESGTAHVTSLPPPTSPFGQMVRTVNLLIDHFDRTGQEIAYVRQVFRSSFISRLHGGRILPGQMTPRISSLIKVVNSNDFTKNRTDAFSSKELEQFLIAHQVDDIYLVGLDAAFCVYYTALGALQRGYRVTVVTDGVMTGRKWERVQQNYHKKGIIMVSSRELLVSPAATETV